MKKLHNLDEWLYGSLRRETRRDIYRANRIMRRGLLILCILWAIGLAAFIYIGGETHHGHAVYVPGGIEIYP